MAQQKKKKVGPGAAMQNRADTAIRAPHITADAGYSALKMTRPVGVCFGYGEVGQLQRNCIKTAAPRSYPFDSKVFVNNDLCCSDCGSSDLSTLLHDTLLDHDPDHELHLMCEVEGHI